MRFSLVPVAALAGKALAQAGEFSWYGTNVAGAEFGEDTLPGEYGKHYTFPDTAAIDTLLEDGYNTFRIQFKMERLTPDDMTGPYDEAYLANLTESISHVTSAGAYAVLDPHNYGRFDGEVITDTSAFETFWTNLATHFASDGNVIFDTNNEYHTMDQDLVLNLNQAAIDGIRAAGASDHWIFAEGNEWSGAWSWPDVNDNMKALVDPRDGEPRLVYQMHQYLDEDSSGTNEACVSESIGAERLVAATEWLRENEKVALLGEFAGAANPTCEAAVEGLLDYLAENDDVWLGFLWWAAGPWWGDYMFSFEPPNGTGYSAYNELVKGYIP